MMKRWDLSRQAAQRTRIGVLAILISACAACSPGGAQSDIAESEQAPAVAAAPEPSVASAPEPDTTSNIYTLERVKPDTELASGESDTQTETLPAPVFGLPELRDLARRRATEPYQPSRALPEPAKRLNYDQYRRIIPKQDDMSGEERPGQVRVLFDPRGYLFDHEVKINLIDGETVSPLPYDASLFDFKDLDLPNAVTESLGFAGLKLLQPLNEAGKFDEVLSFKGASFFRALGAGSVYGASARGLSIGTASSEGEEFPAFREFWIKRPSGPAGDTFVFALMDSPSLTGAFQFRVAAGPTTRMDVEASFYARKKVAQVGLSPLTSMYYFSPHDVTKRGDDYRPAVHDSEGLAIHMANGEWVWRPLQNPAALEVSVLAGRQPNGFGLVQRHRKFEHYSDLEADYHQRPDVWVEPKGDWGGGQLMLVEIPTSNEYNDNIAVFWRPEQALMPGAAFTVSYTMNWGLKPGVVADVATVSETRAGQKPGDKNQIFVLDYKGAPAEHFRNAEIEVSTSAGRIINPVLQPHPDGDTQRLSFELDAEGAAMAELRAVLTKGGQPITETWLYRWSAK